MDPVNGRFANAVLIAVLLTVLAEPARAEAAAASPADFEILQWTGADAATATAPIVRDLRDAQWAPLNYPAARRQGRVFWLKLRARRDLDPQSEAALIVRKGRHLQVQVFVPGEASEQPRTPAVALAGVRAQQDAVILLPADRIDAGESLHVRVEARGRGSETLRFSVGTVSQVLQRGAAHERTIALAFGALTAVSLVALLLWFVLSDRLLLLYATLFSLQALYIAYLAGPGFDWPVLSLALPLTANAWNVPIALSGAVACLFVREIADLKRFSPRVFAVFGGLAIAFVVLAAANVAQLFNLGGAIAVLGNVLFIGAAIFSMVVAFMAWRRGNRAAGWFLVAWLLLEIVTISTALSLLIGDAESAESLVYYGLPVSMVAAAILIALGVGDRLREQRLALTDAEKRAQTDPLTGVLNRGSLLERLDAACARAQARGLPISLLFIDLDHFKDINDTYGHAAGDAFLAAVIGPIQAELRQSDVIGRYGGEEFIVVLSSADATAAQPIAERIRNRVADVTVHGFGPPIHVTCSIGLAASDTLGLWGEALIASADAAVYAAKRAGRNRVQNAEPLAA